MHIHCTAALHKRCAQHARTVSLTRYTAADLPTTQAHNSNTTNTTIFKPTSKHALIAVHHQIDVELTCSASALMLLRSMSVISVPIDISAFSLRVCSIDSSPMMSEKSTCLHLSRVPMRSTHLAKCMLSFRICSSSSSSSVVMQQHTCVSTVAVSQHMLLCKAI
jgi:hypothetical protein